MRYHQYIDSSQEWMKKMNLNFLFRRHTKFRYVFLSVDDEAEMLYTQSILFSLTFY